jgi:hypothetical protein
MVVVADLDTAIPDGDSHTSPRLHSTTEVKGYEIHALNGIIGHVHDFLLDDTNWRITALAINTRNCLPGGRNVLVHYSSTYQNLTHTSVGFFLGDFKLHASLKHIINDGLMVIFFLLLGLEIK